jgi:hypothetical protein
MIYKIIMHNDSTVVIYFKGGSGRVKGHWVRSLGMGSLFPSIIYASKWWDRTRDAEGARDARKASRRHIAVRPSESGWACVQPCHISQTRVLSSVEAGFTRMKA